MLLRSPLLLLPLGRSAGRLPAPVGHRGQATQVPLTGDDYQYLQRCVVPTDKFQASLPRLPLPSLPKTLERYLQSQRALLAAPLDGPALAHTEATAAAFGRDAGPRLHARLRQQNWANKDTSYINAPWTDMYLKDRRSVVFHHNPGIIFAHDSRSPMRRNDGLRAANMLIASLRFHKSYAERRLNPEVYHLSPSKTNNDKYWRRVRLMPNLLATPIAYLFKTFPLDMSQYDNLFQSTRLPQPERDVIYRDAGSKHMVVLRRGHFYVFDVYDRHGQLFPPAYYLAQIRYILQDVADAPSSGIGVLTGTDRDAWYEARQHLIALGNQNVLSQIDTALYAICLDDDWSFDEQNIPASVKNVVAGTDPANRWFDKSFSLVFSNNGVVGINFEHAWGDGVAVMRFIDEVVVDSQKHDFVQSDDPDLASADVAVRRLHVNTDAKIEKAVAKARVSYMAQLDQVDFQRFLFEGFGRDDVKRVGLNADSVMQAAFQMAHARLHGYYVSSYESCSTAIHRHGRTETVRPLTPEVRACAEAFHAGKTSEPELLEQLKLCSNVHSTLTRQAAQGQGWDRHLFALKHLATSEGCEEALPDLFRDPSYERINRNAISTSTLSSQNMAEGGFCPVVRDGYGLAYQMRNDHLGAYVATFKNQREGGEMVRALRETFIDIEWVIKHTSKI